MVIGVTSDTHGEVHPKLLTALRDAQVGLILHAGDVGDQSVLDLLRSVAPVQAVRGNVDSDPPLLDLPEQLILEVEGKRILITHVGRPTARWLEALPDPRPDVVVHGHSHKAHVERRDGVLFLNPGSAGTRRRFGGGLSAALLRFDGEDSDVELIILEEGGGRDG